MKKKKNEEINKENIEDKIKNKNIKNEKKILTIIEE